MLHSCRIVLVAIALLAGAGPRAWARRPAMAVGAQSAAAAPTPDLDQLDANQISMVVSNVGSFAYDMVHGNAGLEYPRGSGRTSVFAGGLWLGAAQPAGGPRLAISEYSFEYGPGAILPNHLPDDPTRPEYRVYKLQRYYTSDAVRD